MSRTLIFAIFLTTFGTNAHAGMWSEFLERCLTPYLAGEDPDISGLVPIPEPAVEGETIDIVQPADGSFLMSSFNPGPYQDFSCGIKLPEGADIEADVAEFQAWIDAAGAEGKIEVSESADFAIQARSVEHELGLFTFRGYLGRSGAGPSFTIARQ